MENRLQLIFNHASALFIKKGYAQTQMKDIAKQINLSTGMLYVYFTSKKDLLDFVLATVMAPGSDYLNQEFTLPIDSKQFIGLKQQVETVLRQNAKQFYARYGEHDYTFPMMLSDAFDLIEKYAVGLLVIEKNPAACAELFDYYMSYRQLFFQQIDDYLEYFIRHKQVRAVEYRKYTAQLLIETITWWAVDIRYDTFVPDPHMSPEIAKKVCLDNLIHAYAIR